jgi:ribosome-associated heat shock protein Hsp15
MNSLLHPPAAASAGETASLRLDKWLWFARFFKSRSLATRFIETGHARVRGAPAKPHTAVHADDVITFTVGGVVRVVRIRALGTRRGPAVEAKTLYEELTSPAPEGSPESRLPFYRDGGAGRPTKAERRALDRLRAPERERD